MVSRSQQLLGDRAIIINSIFDPLELSYILDRKDEIYNGTDGYRSTSEITDINEKLGLDIDALYQSGEVGGERKHLVEQGVSRTIDGPANLTWVSTSCFMHTFIDPSPELEFLLRCEEDSNATVGVGGTLCNSNGTIGLVFAAYHQLKMTLWGPAHRWEVATVNGNTLRSVIDDFMQGSLSNEVVQETCHGPNCVDLHRRTGTHECMEFIEIEYLDNPIPFVIKCIGMISFFGISFFGLFFRFSKFTPIPLSSKTTGTYPAKNATTEKQQLIVVGPISIYVKPSKNKRISLLSKTAAPTSSSKRLLVDGVTFSLPRGAITALTGRSGSGKSTFISAMMQQVDTKLDVYSTQNLLRDFKVVYLRQYAHCEGMENMTAERFLRCNAALYNASEECLLRLIHFIYRFKSTKIGSLSGGQIR